MPTKNERVDPTFSFLTLDVTRNILDRAANPAEAGAYLTDEIRELTGARTVILFACSQETASEGYRIVSVNPEKRRPVAESKAISHLADAARLLSEATAWRALKSGDEIEDFLYRSELGATLAVPLKVGDSAVGVILALDVPDEPHANFAATVLDFLSTVVALILRNALLFEEQESIIETRTSERTRAEEELRRLAMAIDQISEGIVISDAEGKIVFVNPAFERITGYTHEEALGQRPDVLLKSGEHDEAFFREMYSTIGQGNMWQGLVTTRNKNGSLSKTELTISPVHAPSGEITNFVSVQRDVTEEQNLEARLRQSQKMEAIGTLAGGIAHDFNNILSAVLGFASLAMDDVPQNSDVHDSLTEIAKAGNRAKDLVQQILAFSRRTEREQKPLRMHLVVEEALKLLRGSIPSTVEIGHSVDTKCGVVMADPSEIHQVIMNLCTNAYQALPDTGGSIQVDLIQVRIGREQASLDPDLRSGEYARLTIRDTGHGMDRITQARIFEPYFTTKERGEGTGLGLSTVHGIIRSHGGSIRVYSEPGAGTKFTILLPVVSRGAGLPKEKERDSADIAGDERILLVDDEEQIAMFSKIGLERLGYRVTTQTSSIEALEVFRAAHGQFDLVITDQMMPGMRGTEFAQRILEIRPDIPVIFCSGFGEDTEHSTYTEIGVRARVEKPIAAEDLAKAIRKVLGQQKTDCP